MIESVCFGFHVGLLVICRIFVSQTAYQEERMFLLETVGGSEKNWF